MQNKAYKAEKNPGFNHKKNRILLLLIIAFLLMIFLIVVIDPFDQTITVKGTSNASADFEYKIDKSGYEVSYMSVLYLEGYVYSPSPWLSYSQGLDLEPSIEKGQKIGEVALDLKGKIYTDIPPDFSSTHDVGTEIYEIKDIKKERAILLKEGMYEVVFYRSSKALLSEDEKMNLNVSHVFDMISNSSDVVAVELRSEEDGSWMRTIENHSLLDVINDELSDQAIKNRGELSIEPYTFQNRLPINLMFDDGAAVHMQVYPDIKYASIFGGYVEISQALVDTLESLRKEGEVYSRLTQIIPFTQDQMAYLKVNDYKTGLEVLCSEPKWSIGVLYEMLGYFRVLEAKEILDGNLLISFAIGKSKEDHITLEFYEDAESFVKVDGLVYEIVKGVLTYENFKNYIMNYTN